VPSRSVLHDPDRRSLRLVDAERAGPH
jgi:hypothetical protein